jgi:peroxiredoxin
MKTGKKRQAQAAKRRRAKSIRRAVIAAVLAALLGLGGWAVFARPGDQEAPVYFTTAAPNITLDTLDGRQFVSSEHRGEHNLLLYFSEGIGCGACWDQIVDFEADADRFADLDVEFVSIMVDSLPEISAESQARGITGTVAVDPDKDASQRYDTMEASMHPGVKPGHSFILVNKYGRIIWRWDWPGHGKPMYLEVDELYDSVSEWLERSGDKAL